jgi:MFS family permease
MNILPLYMTRKGFSDEEIALFITFRFLGVFILALPLGKFIKKKKLMPLFFLSNIFVPLFGIGIVVSIALSLKYLTLTALILWGASFTFMQVPISPFILRNAQKHNQTSAIALSYSTWSFAGILSGLVIAILDAIAPNFFDEQFILLLFSILGFGGLIFLRRIKNFNEHTDENFVPKILPHITNKKDKLLLLKALVPTLIIATGAGLTIPFISLFFDQVHHLDKGDFSALSAIAAVLVAYCAMLVPKVKQTIGYKIAIPTTQSFAVLALILLATTQLYAQQKIAVYLAMFCFLLRQPLMNIAGPMTSEIVMNYVGKRNQEIVSALTAAIWSGSWFVSSKIFAWLRSLGIQYVYVFLITALLYGVGVIWYYILILDYVKREKAGLIESEQKIL